MYNYNPTLPITVKPAAVFQLSVLLNVCFKRFWGTDTLKQGDFIASLLSAGTDFSHMIDRAGSGQPGLNLSIKQSSETKKREKKYIGVVNSIESTRRKLR